MADEPKGRTVEVKVATSVETAGSVSWEKIMLAALPRRSEAESRAHYDRAKDAEEIRSTGYHGYILTETAEAGAVSLMLVNGDPEKVVARLTMPREDFVRFADAIAGLIEERKLRR